jgi:hypothetical protein
MNRFSWRARLIGGAALGLLASGTALAQAAPGKGTESTTVTRTTVTTTTGEKIRSVGDSAGKIASQPVTDLGAKATEIPPVLLDAQKYPYSLTGTRSCAQIGSGVKSLNTALGADYASNATVKKENRAGKLAEAGGQSVVNGLIPFRGIIRELSGAAPAQRRMNAAVDAGIARRGFLRGLYVAKGCKASL